MKFVNWHNNVLWLGVLVVFFALITVPSGFLHASSWPWGNSKVKEFNSVRLNVAKDEVKSVRPPSAAYAYAFKWEGGLFDFSINDAALQQVIVSHDLSEGTDNSYSEMYFNLKADDVITIYNVGAKNIELMLINPDDQNVKQPVGDTSVANVPAKQMPQATLASNPPNNMQTNYLGNKTLVNRGSGADYSELNIISRKTWGADESKAHWEPKYKKINRITVHHSAWTNDPEGNFAKTVRAIYLFHAAGRGWGDIGYNYLIDPYGNIYEGRKGGAGAIGAHAGGFNAGNIGISMMGDFSNHLPSTAARKSLKNLLAERALMHGFQLEWQGSQHVKTVYGHRDFNITACPGDKLYQHLPTIVGKAEIIRSDAEAQGHIIATARETAETTLAGITDTRLKITFTSEALATKTPQQLLPARSGIIYRSTNTNSATIAVESIPGYNNNWTDDTANRLIDLYTGSR